MPWSSLEPGAVLPTLAPILWPKWFMFLGKLIQCRVTGIATKRPRGDQLDQANPVRNDETGLWQCPFCKKNDFPELSEVSVIWTKCIQ